MNWWLSAKDPAEQNKYHRSKIQMKIVTVHCFTDQGNVHNQPLPIPVQAQWHTEYRKPKTLPYSTADMQHFIGKGK